MGVDVTISGIQELSRLQAFLNPALHDKALKGGLSYAAKAAKTSAAKNIRARYNIAAARIKKDITGPSFSGDRATLRFSRRPPTLAQFGFKPGTRGHQPGLGQGLGWGPATPPGKPATALIFRGGKRQQYSGTFLLPNGVPVHRKGNRLIADYGPSVGSIFAGKSQFGDAIRAETQARINEQFIKGFQRVLDSAARGYGK
jgi:hypothetical protein